MINILLAGLLIAAGLYLLSVDSYVLKGMLFIGLSKYLLSAALLFMASFVGTIAWGWISGGISKPPASSFWFDPTYVHPTYKGEILIRYWYIMVPALICFALALAFADAAPDDVGSKAKGSCSKSQRRNYGGLKSDHPGEVFIAACEYGVGK